MGGTPVEIQTELAMSDDARMTVARRRHWLAARVGAGLWLPRNVSLEDVLPRSIPFAELCRRNAARSNPCATAVEERPLWRLEALATEPFNTSAVEAAMSSVRTRLLDELHSSRVLCDDKRPCRVFTPRNNETVVVICLPDAVKHARVCEP
jgi:hypothetical protein